MKGKNKYKLVKKKGRVQIVIESLKGQNLNLREVEDIQNGLLDYVLPIEVRVKRKSFTLTYDITNYIPLHQYIHTLVNRKKYVEIMLQILRVFQRMTETYYNPQNLLLELDKVMVNPSMNKVLFVFVPILYFNCEVSTKEFLTQLTYHTTFDDSEDISYVEKSLEILQRNVNFSVVELEEYLKSLQPEKVAISVSETEKSVPQYKDYSSYIKRENQIAHQPKVTGYLTDVGSSTDTVKLGEGELSYVKQVRTGKLYYLKQAETRLGKKQCHVEVADNTAISKLHAVIQKEEGKYFLMDVGSTNGTKVEGKRITPREKVLLKDEYCFELADEKFVFYE